MGGKSKKPGTLPSAGELFTELNTFKEVVVPNPFLRALGQTPKYKKYGLKQAKLKEKPDTKFKGGVKGGKVINETKIVDFPTPMLDIYNKGLQEMKKYKIVWTMLMKY